MKLKIKCMDIATGGPLVAIINHEDANTFDLHEMDRIKILKGKKIETVTVDIAKSEKTVRKGYLGVFDEAANSLKLKNNDYVIIKLTKKPVALDYIRMKMDGQPLNEKQIDQIVWDIVHNRLSSIEITYFVAACYSNVLSIDETMFLIKAMVKYGEILKLNRFPIIDKHCIGGIPGNRTTMVLVPIIAAAGFTIPKTSSRSITSPAGTADTMEVLSKVSFNLKKMKKIILKNNGCIVWGGALNLAPADDKIINVEKPLGIDAESQLVASIMSKKYSVSSTHILIDIPIGNDAKVKNKKEALRLKKNFVIVGKRLNKKVRVILTDGTQPIGNGIGPSLEARDVLYILRRDPRRPLDLEKKCINMAAEIFKMVGVKKGKEKAIKILESGLAYKKMSKIVRAQGGKMIDPYKIKIGKHKFDIKAKKSGIINHIDNNDISKIARIAGAPIHNGSGIFLYKHKLDRVKKGENLYTIYSESKIRLKHALEVEKELNAFVISR